MIIMENRLTGSAMAMQLPQVAKTFALDMQNRHFAADDRESAMDVFCALIRAFVNAGKYTFSNMYFSTFNINMPAVDNLLDFVSSGIVTDRIYLIFNSAAVRMNEEKHDLIARTLAKSERIKFHTMNTHAKLMLAKGEDFCFSIITSANMAENSNLESYYIDFSQSAFDFHSGVIKSIIGNDSAAPPANIADRSAFKNIQPKGV